MVRIVAALGIGIVLLMNGCASVTKQDKKKMVVLDASQDSDIEGTGMSSTDLRSMTQRMALEIATINWGTASTNAVNVKRIALMDVDNQTRFPLSADMIKDLLLGGLMEHSAGSSLEFTTNPTGAMYFLSTRITALSKGSSDGVSDYLLYSFRLVDQNDTVKWMKTYETKKQGKTGVMYR